jgi:transcriptional regulator with XRE-family HTH domain
VKKKSRSRQAVAPPVDNADHVSDQLCRRVKELRQSRGWSLEALSAACGVSRSMLSQIERNEANPTLAVTVRIAQAFGLTLAELVEQPQASSSIHVIRANDREYHYRSDTDCSIRTLSPLHLEKDVEFYELELKPGACLQSAAHFEGTREFLTVQKGRLRVTSGEEVVDVEKGDSASYHADVPHAIANTGRSAATAFLVVIYD